MLDVSTCTSLTDQGAPFSSRVFHSRHDSDTCTHSKEDLIQEDLSRVACAPEGEREQALVSDKDK